MFKATDVSQWCSFKKVVTACLSSWVQDFYYSAIRHRNNGTGLLLISCWLCGLFLRNLISWGVTSHVDTKWLKQLHNVQSICRIFSKAERKIFGKQYEYKSFWPLVVTVFQTLFKLRSPYKTVFCMIVYSIEDFLGFHWGCFLNKLLNVFLSVKWIKQLYIFLLFLVWLFSSPFWLVIN